jgi:hypothetical protein
MWLSFGRAKFLVLNVKTELTLSQHEKFKLFVHSGFHGHKSVKLSNTYLRGLRATMILYFFFIFNQ